MTRRWRWNRAIALALSGLLATFSQAQTVLRVGTTAVARQYHPLLTAIYQEIGLTPEFVELPPERSLRNLENGEVDADLGRAAGSSKGYRNMVETQEIMVPVVLTAVVRKGFGADITRSNLPTYRVGIVRGYKLPETFARQAGATPEIANSVESVLQMLKASRLDIVLLTSATPLSQYPQFDGILVAQPKPLQVANAVHIFGSRWAEYVPRFDAAVRTMRADGRLAKLLPPQ